MRSKIVTTGIKTVEEFIERACKVHGNVYDYSLIKEYPGANKKIPIIDPIYGVFYQTPYNHLRGFGIRRRYIESTTESKRKKRLQKFIEKAKIIHGNIYDYSEADYVDMKTKIKIIDKDYGIFYQTPEVHLRGHGHPFRKKVSSGEYIIENFLKKMNISYERQKSFPDLKSNKTNYKLRFDFYIPEYNTVIEFNGIQHYKKEYCFGKNKVEKFEKLNYNDLLKKIYAEKNNIKYLEISYREKNRIEEILKEIFIK